MSSRTKIAILAAWALAAAGLLIAGWGSPAGPPPELSGEVATSRNWLALILGGFAINYVVAWFYRASWTVTLVRSLLWAVVAYICISDIVDIFGENWGLAGQILGSDGPGEPEVVSGLRWRLALRVAGLASAAICIGVGFERRVDEADGRDRG
jgi:hypothetical protein